MINTILLTGSTGFLGSHMLRGLLSAGYQVICLKRSFSDNTRNNDIGFIGKITVYDIDAINLEDIFIAHKIDCIIHTATLYGRRDEDATVMLQSNVLFPLRLLELAAQYEVKAFINTDTFINDKGRVYDYLSNYTLTKRQFHDWLTVYSGKLRTANCKLWHLYGPKDDKSKFIVFITQSILAGKPTIELTDGLQKRDFVYVEDVVSAYLAILANIEAMPAEVNEFDIGSGQSFSVRHVVEQISLLCGDNATSLQFGALPQRQGEYQDSVAAISSLQKLGWQPKYNLQQGLLETIASERKNFSL